MNVQDVMVPDVATCRPDDNLESIARTMREQDIGAVPVVDDTGHPVGMVTDRDIVIESAGLGKGPVAMHAGDIGIKKVTTIRAEEEVSEALARMRAAAVRRLPVVDKDGAIQGMVSLGDVIEKARDENGEWTVSPSDLESMLAAVTGHH